MRLNDKQFLFVRSMGKALRVTALFTSVDEANEYSKRHSDEGVVAEFGSYILIANLYDQGTAITDSSVNRPQNDCCDEVNDEMGRAAPDLLNWMLEVAEARDSNPKARTVNLKFHRGTLHMWMDRARKAIGHRSTRSLTRDEHEE